MWLKDTLADREDYIFHLECLVEDREKEIDEAIKYIENLPNSKEINIYQEDKSWVYLLMILRGDE